MFFQSPYTKTPLFVYERPKNKSPYTETGCFVYGPLVQREKVTS